MRIDLTKEKIVKQPLPLDLAVNFIGSAGINARILYDEVGPGIDPFDPENRLIYGFGPLVGTSAPACARFTVTGKGPFTFAFSDSNSGGFFGVEVKFSGYDCIVFQGRAKKPMYLWIDDDVAELRSASHLWGKDVWETDEEIKEELGDPKIKTSIIGPAGENLVRYAVPINDRIHAPGWGGMGAVMGAKNLKAIAVRGTKRVKIARPDEFEKACSEARNMILKSDHTKLLRKYQRTWLNELYQNVYKELLYKNYLEPRVPPDLFPEMDHHHYLDLVVENKNTGCYGCPVACIHFLEVKEGRWAGTTGYGYQFTHQKNVQAMGIIDRALALVWCNETNRLGTDSSGPAYAISWTMECLEKGILTKKGVGVDLTWGNQDAALEMLRKIVYREGFGNLLAEGVQLASKKIGKGSEDFALHVKGKVLQHDPRASWLTALSFATATRGADHLKSCPMSNTFARTMGLLTLDSTTTDFVAEAVIFHEKLHSIVDSIGICKNCTAATADFSPGWQEIAELLSYATGIDFTVEDLMKAGERIYNVERAFNAREGLTRDDDTYVRRFFTPHPIVKLKVPFNLENFEKLKDRYYKLHGWNVKSGNPTREKLTELGLKYIADDLERRRIT